MLYALFLTSYNQKSCFELVDSIDINEDEHLLVRLHNGAARESTTIKEIIHDELLGRDNIIVRTRTSVYGFTLFVRKHYAYDEHRDNDTPMDAEKRFVRDIIDMWEAAKQCSDTDTEEWWA